MESKPVCFECSEMDTPPRKVRSTKLTRVRDPLKKNSVVFTDHLCKEHRIGVEKSGFNIEIVKSQ